MGFYTDSLQLFYKQLGPTGSSGTALSGSLIETWYDRDVSHVSYTISSSFLNFPKDDGIQPNYLTTRNATYNATYKALPWGSHACDFLWNVSVPSWSYADTQYATDTFPTQYYTIRQWSVSYTSKSFHKSNANYGSVGQSSYSVTSSWFIYDAKFDNANQLAYATKINSNFIYPTFVGSDNFVYNFIDSGTTPSPGQGEEWRVAYDINYPTINANSSSSIDKQYFDVGTGAAITRASISSSLVTQSIYGSTASSTANNNCTRALKQRRLFFPTYVSASGTTLSQDYFLKLFTGYQKSDLFQDNGGIYNVQFTLKRKVSKDCYQDSNTFMSVFIADVQTALGNPSTRVPGAAGWYPPDNNIVKIGNGYNGSPALSYYEIATGYEVERFNFNVIQYGTPAQLCFEVSGSLAADGYFGAIISDVRICKVGVTTDPQFIKPATVGGYVFETLPFEPYNPPLEFA